MQQEQLKELLDKYAAGQCSDKETALLESWYADWNEKNRLPVSDEMLILAQQRLWSGLSPNINTPVYKRRLWPRIAAVASILLLLSVSTYWLLQNTSKKQLISTHYSQDFKPGSNKAILTLADGQKINLTDAGEGQLAYQGKTVIEKSEGKISYAAQQENKLKTSVIQYNTVSTPRSGKWLVILPDNSRVWLDAQSSIRFPTVFNGNSRAVEITGQAYFEVTHNPKKPFRVASNGQFVEVLGTHFNINAYPDEPIMKTTLLEGSVNILVAGKKARLVPGQQAIVVKQDRNAGIILKEVSTEEAIAWKNGFFQFNHSSIEEVMRQTARWYNVKIRYEGKIPQRQFTGNLPRASNASKLLEILKFTGVHFRIEGQTIVVTP